MDPITLMLVSFAISVGVSYLLRPKQKVIHARPAEEFQVPTAEEGRPVPVLFGTRRISGPNVVWWGDIKSTAIKR